MSRRRTTHIPRCPFCFSIMEEVQLRFGEIGWEEVWGCDSCHTNHVFPARIEFLQKVKNSKILEAHTKILHLPK